MKYFILVLVLALSGCANFRTEYLGNRITCTVAKDKAYVTSLWGIIGISSEIVTKDSKIICSKQTDEVK
jgi:uncharacterized membrane protein